MRDQARRATRPPRAQHPGEAVDAPCSCPPPRAQTPRQSGQSSCPAANRDSTRAASASTVTNGASVHPARPSRSGPPRHRAGGPLSSQLSLLATLTVPKRSTRQPGPDVLGNRNDAHPATRRHPERRSTLAQRFVGEYDSLGAWVTNHGLSVCRAGDGRGCWENCVHGIGDGPGAAVCD